MLVLSKDWVEMLDQSQWAGEPLLVVDDIRNALVRHGVSSSLLKNFPVMPADVEGILLYGSQARGDAVDGSDVDIIALVPDSRPSVHVDDISISYYTQTQLRSGIGTLFSAHLKRDGKVVCEQGTKLSSLISGMGEVDVPRVLSRSLNMAQLFTTPEMDLPKYLPGLLRQARYLLRSCLYAHAIAVNEPCFSVRELAVRHGDLSLSTLLASRHKEKPSIEDYKKCLSWLESLLGEFPRSLWGSLEAAVVNEWGNGSDLLSMAFMVLSSSCRNIGDYAEVEKILL